LLKIELSKPAIQNEKDINTDGEKKNTNSINKPSNLSTWLREKDATSNQTKKFLAVAAFLQLGGKERIVTSDVTDALKKNNQGKLNNASDNLGQNVGKGHCEKDGKSFYVTPEGFVALGLKID